MQLFGGKRWLVATLFAFVSVPFVGAGCASEIGDDDEELVDEEGEGDVSVSEEQLQDSTTDGCGGECRPDNCVGYARCRTRRDGVKGPSLPYGLTYFSDKLRVAHSARGHRGCVAMIRTSRSYGHAAYVEKTWVSGGVRRYRISEASWSYSYSCDTRSGTKAGLHIAEFWCP